MNNRILGLRTAIYAAPDLNAAKDWYTRVLEIAPYFDQPFYVGFNVSGFELGLDPNAGAQSEGGIVVYWGVQNAESGLQRLLELGATLHSDVRYVGEEIKVATVFDPFGNLFGLIENPHFSLAAPEAS